MNRLSKRKREEHKLLSFLTDNVCTQVTVLNHTMYSPRCSQTFHLRFTAADAAPKSHACGYTDDPDNTHRCPHTWSRNETPDFRRQTRSCRRPHSGAGDAFRQPSLH